MNRRFHDIRDARAILLREQPQCLFCGATARLTLDHIIRKTWGGDPDHEYNLQVLCVFCHNAKYLLESRLADRVMNGNLTVVQAKARISAWRPLGTFIEAVRNGDKDHTQIPPSRNLWARERKLSVPVPFTKIRLLLILILRQRREADTGIHRAENE